MSAIEETPSVSEPNKENTTIGDQSEPTEKNVKTTLIGYRQKLQAIEARIKYREKAIKGFRNHLKKGTFPKRFKSLQPYPKMESPESQAVVHCVILDQMILYEERKLTQDQTSYQTMKKERNVERPQLLKKPKKPRNLLWHSSCRNSPTCNQNIHNSVVN